MRYVEMTLTVPIPDDAADPPLAEMAHYMAEQLRGQDAPGDWANAVLTVALVQEKVEQPIYEPPLAPVMELR